MVASLEQTEWLLGSAGRRVLDRLPEGELPPQVVLRLGADLRRDHPPELVAAALALHDLRVRARAKFSRADEMVFTRSGLEQATSERLARHRAARFSGLGPVADLCSGIGGDLIALAGDAPTLAVDRDPLHLRMAMANAEVYRVDRWVRGIVSDVAEADLSGVAALFVDPARRSERGRSGPGRSDPSLDWCLGLADRIPSVAIKAAPGVDLARVPAGWEVEFVADGRDLKEGVLWSPALAATARRATVIGESIATLVPEPGERVPVAAPGAYLFDPNPAVTRAGLVEDLARRLGGWKIDERIAFLAGDRPLVSPFARTLRVVESLPWHQKRIAVRLRELGIGAVDIRRRGLAGDVEAIRRRFGLRGNGRATLVMTRVADRPWCLICAEVDDERGELQRK